MNDRYHDYSEPVAQLLTLGETKIHASKDYLEYGFSDEHVPELIRMVDDDVLRTMDWDDEGNVPPEVYAQVHAWRVLSELKALEAIPVLVGLFHLIEEEDDDYVSEEVPLVLAAMGEAAIQPCWEYLINPSEPLYARVAAVSALSKIGQDPKLRSKCISALTSVLQNYANEDETLNGFLVSYLVDLKAIESLGLIRRAYEADRVDEFIVGDFEDVEALLC